MTKLRCAHCGARFTPAPQVPNQVYCSKTNCQKERRRQWHKSKLQTDPDYRSNQSRAQKAWADRNPDYWRNRRQGRSDYENPMASEKDLSDAKIKNPFIKMDSLASPQTLPKALQDGVFRLKILAEPDGIKMNSWIVELSNIHATYEPISRRIKR